MTIYKFTSMHVIPWNLIRVADRLAEDRSDEARSRKDEMRCLLQGWAVVSGTNTAHAHAVEVLFMLMRGLAVSPGGRRSRHDTTPQLHAWADGSRRSAGAGMKIASRAQTFRAAGSGR